MRLDVAGDGLRQRVHTILDAVEERAAYAEPEVLEAMMAMAGSAVSMLMRERVGSLRTAVKREAEDLEAGL